MTCPPVAVAMRDAHPRHSRPSLGIPEEPGSALGLDRDSLEPTGFAKYPVCEWQLRFHLRHTTGETFSGRRVQTKRAIAPRTRREWGSPSSYATNGTRHAPYSRWTAKERVFASESIALAVMLFTSWWFASESRNQNTLW